MFSFLPTVTLLGLPLLAFGQGSGALTKVIFNSSFAESSSARCLDGSPAGYFFAPGNTSSFVIFLQGGGACYTVSGASSTNCAARAKTALGSSNYWAATYTDNDNVLSGDPSINPFASFTRVFVPYCSGDVHLGTRTAPVSPDFPFYFSGHHIVSAVITHLKEVTTLSTATSVLLSGSSAGGIGSFVNSDFVAAALPNARVRAAPQGGWFFPAVVNFTAWEGGNSGPPYAGQDGKVSSLWASYLPPACVASKGIPYCSSVPFSYPYLTTPLHVSENQEDSNQLFAQLGVPYNVSNPQAVKFALYFQAAMKAGLAEIASSPVNALFAPACLAHTENLNLAAKTKVGARDYTLRDSLGAWYFGVPNGVPRILMDSCVGLNCNPTCPPLSGATKGGREVENIGAFLVGEMA